MQKKKKKKTNSQMANIFFLNWASFQLHCYHCYTINLILILSLPVFVCGTVFPFVSLMFLVYATLCVYLSVCLYVCLSDRLSVRLAVRSSVCLSVCPYVSPSVHPFVRLCVCASFHLSISPSVCPSSGRYVVFIY